MVSNLAWADPDIFEKGPPPSFLQIQPASRSIFTDFPNIRLLIEQKLFQIFCAEPASPIGNTVNTFRQNGTHIRIRKNDTTILLRIDRSEFARGTYFIPCSFYRGSNLQIAYVAAIGSDMSIRVYRQDEKEKILAALAQNISLPPPALPAPAAAPPENIAALPGPDPDMSGAIGNYSIAKQLFLSVSFSALSVAALFGFAVFGSFEVGALQLAAEITGFLSVTVLMGATFNAFFYPAMKKAKEAYRSTADRRSEKIRQAELVKMLIGTIALYAAAGLFYCIFGPGILQSAWIQGPVGWISYYPPLTIAAFNTIGNIVTQAKENAGNRAKEMDWAKVASAFILGFIFGYLFQLIYFTWQQLFPYNGTFFGKASRAIADPFFGGWLCARILSTYYGTYDRLKEEKRHLNGMGEKGFWAFVAAIRGIGLWKIIQETNRATSLRDWKIPGAITITWGFFVLIQYFNLNAGSVAQMAGIVGFVDLPYLIMLNLATSGSIDTDTNSPPTDRVSPETVSSIVPAKAASPRRQEHETGSQNAESIIRIDTESAPPIDISKIRMTVTDERFLRDPLQERALAQSFKSATTSIVLQKKLVLVLDNKLGGSQRGRIRELFEKIRSITDGNDAFARLWRGNLEIRTSLAALDAFKDDDTADVFVFALDNEKQRKRLLPSGNRHMTFVNENGMPRNAYYPLFDIVAITLAHYIDPKTVNSLKPLYAKMNIENIQTEGDVLTYILLPVAKEHDTRRDIDERYARLAEEILTAA